MNQYTDWIWLIIAGFLEVCWVIGLKYTNGFTEILPSIFTVAALIASGLFLSFAVKTIPIGTAYPVWVGIGSVGASLVGIILFSEPVTILRLLCIFLILLGIAGLSLLKAAL